MSENVTELFNGYINFIRIALNDYYKEIGSPDRLGEKTNTDRMFRIFIFLDYTSEGKFSEDPIKFIGSQIDTRLIPNIHHEGKYWQQIWDDINFKRFFHQQYKNWYFDKFSPTYDNADHKREFKKQLEGYWDWRESKCRKIGNKISCGLFFKGGKRRKKKTKKRKTRRNKRKTRRKKRKKKRKK